LLSKVFEVQLAVGAGLCGRWSQWNRGGPLGRWGLGWRWAGAGLALGWRWAGAGLALGWRWAGAGLLVAANCWAAAGLPLVTPHFRLVVNAESREWSWTQQKESQGLDRGGCG
jgi:hypothetical protein